MNLSFTNTRKLDNRYESITLWCSQPVFNDPKVTFERTEGAKSYLDLLKPGNPRRVFLGCALQMWSQLTGMNVMM